MATVEVLPAGIRSVYETRDAEGLLERCRCRIVKPYRFSSRDRVNTDLFHVRSKLLRLPTDSADIRRGM
jgi:hypothetical protein